MTSPRAADRWLWAAAAVCLGLSLTPWGPLLLYPFKLFTTWVHECGHAVMTLLVGGAVHGITMEPDTSGLTRSLLPSGRIAQGLVASSGYLGASVVGCLLLTVTRKERWARAILWAVGVFLLLTLVIWMRNPFGFVVVLGWGLALVALGRTRERGLSRFVLSVLAVQVALNAVYDIRVLFLVDTARSDAATMARLFAVPAWFWAGAWMLVSVVLLAWTLGLVRMRSSPARR